jgi:hypothetical protein
LILAAAILATPVTLAETTCGTVEKISADRGSPADAGTTQIRLKGLKTRFNLYDFGSCAALATAALVNNLEVCLEWDDATNNGDCRKSDCIADRIEISK